MKTNQDIIENIDRYLSGEMTDEERRSFERDIDRNKNLRGELKLQEGIRSALSKKNKVKLKKELIEIGNEIDNESSPKKLSISIYWYAAACVAIVGLLVFSLLIKPGRSNQEIFITYFEPYPINEDRLRGEGRQESEQFWKFYLNDDYQRSLVILESQRIKNPSDEKLIVYVASCYIKLKHPDKAINVLKNIENQSLFYYDMIWLRSFAFLLKDDLDNFRNGIKELANSNSLYTNTASEIEASF